VPVAGAPHERVCGFPIEAYCASNFKCPAGLACSSGESLCRLPCDRDEVCGETFRCRSDGFCEEIQGSPGGDGGPGEPVGTCAPVCSRRGTVQEGWYPVCGDELVALLVGECSGCVAVCRSATTDEEAAWVSSCDVTMVIQQVGCDGPAD
jgi:hypothetical protein